MAQERDVGIRKSRRRRSPPPAARPLHRFFKIIFSDALEDRRMRIPAKFVKKFRNELSEVATLILPNGRNWQVELTRSHNQIWFDAGWYEFVEHNSIGCRFLLVFTYRGSSNFNVLIFDTSACEIQYPCDSRSFERPNCGKKHLVNDDDDEIEDVELVDVSGHKISSPSSFSCKSRAFDKSASKGESSRRQNRPMEVPHGTDISNSLRSKRCKLESADEVADYNSNELRRGNSDEHEMLNPYGTPVRDGKASKIIPDHTDVANEMFTSGFTRASKESEKAIHAARTFKSKNPSFMVALRSYNFSNYIVHVPGEFAKRYMTDISEYIKVHVPDGRQWPVRVNRNKIGGFAFGRGWSEFSKENNLKIGDVCVFELVNKNSGLKVLIFPAVQDINPDN